jgi:hypothetical protein
MSTKKKALILVIALASIIATHLLALRYSCRLFDYEDWAMAEESAYDGKKLGCKMMGCVHVKTGENSGWNAPYVMDDSTTTYSCLAPWDPTARSKSKR